MSGDTDVNGGPNSDDVAGALAQRTTDFSGSGLLGLFNVVENAGADGVGSDAIELTLGASTMLYDKDGFHLGGSGALRYMNGGVDSFVEHGPGVPLAVESQDIDSFLLDVGVDLSYQVTQQFTVAGRLGYVHEMSDSEHSVSSTFAASGTDAQLFSVSAPGIDGQAVTLNAGLFYDLNENTRLGATYHGEFGGESMPTQTFGISAAYGF